MTKNTWRSLLRTFRVIGALLLLTFAARTPAFAQLLPGALPAHDIQRCYTMEAMQEALSKNPGLVEEWRRNGERAVAQYHERIATNRAGLADTVIIPVVFHLIDEQTRLDWITDRNIYDQVEILNEAFNGVKANRYRHVIPQEIFSRKGDIPIKFVLARRTPMGDLTNGIERRTGVTPDRKAIKSTAAGGLDPWDTDRYLNIWVGTFTGDDKNLLGVATFPFTNTEGPQGVVVGIATLPYTSNVSRSYYPIYSEGATLVHELGHYFYLYHTFGDLTYCNNEDFRTQSGWPLPTGAGPEGDDTPEQKRVDNLIYGNPSVNYSDGCSMTGFGEMYGSFMNYFDDRALFMFSNGHKKRVLGCIELYRSNVAGSDGAVAPVPVTDAYLVGMLPYGTPEKRTPVRNGVALTVKVRNYGNTILNTVRVTLNVDGAAVSSSVFTLNLAPGANTEVNLGPLNLADGNRILTVYTSSPNGGADRFTENDTLQSFLSVVSSTVDGPFSESFDGATFPPAGWRILNPNGDGTWTRDAVSGRSNAGSATMQFRNFSGSGQLDELVMPAVNLGNADSSFLTFSYAYAALSSTVSSWDGLEVYISNDHGRTYQMISRKTGDFLKTISGYQSTPFQALPGEPKWTNEKLNLSPYLNGSPLLIRFRATNARGNNLYIDDVKVSIVTSYARDAQLMSISGLEKYICEQIPEPVVTFRSNGKDALTNLKLNYRVDDGAFVQQAWQGSLSPNQATSVTIPTPTGLQPGRHTVTVYTSDPNGLADEDPGNDTMRFEFYLMGSSPVPLKERFEGATFPPTQWVIKPNGNGQTWQRTTAAHSEGSASAVIKNFDHNMGGRADILFSPRLIPAQTYDSLFFSFDYAYAPGSNYPGAPGNAEDTLEVKLTTDCGQSFVTLFKMFGNEMITVEDPASWKNRAFVARDRDWRQHKVLLNPIVGNSSFQIYFISKGNHRNNLYLDNVEVYGINVPPLLKERGYLIYPSPFTDQFIVRNYEQPTDLKSIQVYNATGQLIWQQRYNGSAEKQIPVNTAAWARGIYTVKILYQSKTIIDRVVKQ